MSRLKFYLNVRMLLLKLPCCLLHIELLKTHSTLDSLLGCKINNGVAKCFSQRLKIFGFKVLLNSFSGILIALAARSFNSNLMSTEIKE
ncbi:CLUMA_CG020623, isoform A [Clunio marinus]|uniref:CLUMA_CG020623, isoform A n=1 Tax=Clunio marinus TaxID=568069 RepID=A0A1J1J5I4_9DIPT|nr:CLUMA_CG020623, isoform A [Clunio marinus]